MRETSYVVRIYRREAQAPQDGARRRKQDRIALAGIVEDVEREERRPFRDLEELWAILARAPGGVRHG